MSTTSGCTPRRFVATIGIDRYHDRAHPTLQNAEADADRVERVLTGERFGFEVLKSLRGSRASFDGLTRWLDRELPAKLRGQACPDDLLIVYYAGHGHGDIDAGVAWLVPHDGRVAGSPDSAAPRGIPVVSRLLTGLDALDFPQILLILDACDMGMVFGTAVQAVQPLGQLAARTHQRKSRKLITAAGFLEGAQDAAVVDARAGPLAQALVHGLTSGDADLYGDGTVSFSELGIYLQAEVGRETSGFQVPEFGAFGGDARGEPVIATVEPVEEAPIESKSLRELDELSQRAIDSLQGRRFVDALRRLKRLDALRTRVGRRARTLLYHASFAEARGAWAEAREAIEEALTLRQALFPGGHPSTAALMQRVAAIAEKSGASDADVMQARASDGWDHAMARRFSSLVVAATVGEAARWAWRRGHIETTRMLLDTAVTLETLAKAPARAAVLRHNESVVHAAADEGEEAVRFADEAAALARHAPIGEAQQVEILVQRGRALEMVGRVEEAAEALAEALPLTAPSVAVAREHLRDLCRRERVGCPARDDEQVGSHESDRQPPNRTAVAPVSEKQMPADVKRPVLGQPSEPIGELSATRQVVDRPAADLRVPQWSPDGQQLSFEVHRHDRAVQTWIAHFSAGLQKESERQVTRGRSAASAGLGGRQEPIVDFDWAPDMKAAPKPYLYARAQYSNFTLYVDGGLELTDPNIVSARHPSWSVSGQYIAFVGRYRRSTHIAVIDLQGGWHKPLPMPKRAGVIDMSPLYGPSKDSLLYVRWLGSLADADIHVILDAARAADTTGVVTGWPGHEIRPAWSPDNRRVAFYANADYAGDPERFDLWVVDLSGQNAVRLARNAWVDEPMNFLVHRRSRPVWSPDGQTILYVQRDDERRNPIAWVSVDGARRGVLDTGTQFHEDLALRPDGNGWVLAFTAHGWRGTSNDKYAWVYVTRGSLL